jgi:membrane-bound lytic murein transglycosylase A
MRLHGWRPRWGAVAVLLALAGCASMQHLGGQPGAAGWTAPAGAGPAFTPIGFDQLPGWSSDQAAQALATFLEDCGAWRAQPDATLGGRDTAATLGGTADKWQPACAAAQSVPAGDAAAARTFFEAWFRPYGLSADGSAQGLFTGYYEPEVPGSRTETSVYRTPLLRRPPDLGSRPTYYTRAQIDGGALKKRHLELLWLADPIDAFFLHIQGAGRVRLSDGQIVRVTYDGQNGQQYVPIGRVLVARGEMTLDQVSMQSVRAWLAAHPAEAKSVMDANPSYIFFREVHDTNAGDGPPSTLGVPLRPERSLAIDKDYVPLGAPVWIDTKDPVSGAPIQRLMMGQDLGGAIKGPVRADIFFGWGKDAEQRAGLMRQQGTEVVLLPNPAAGKTAAR